MLMLVSMFHQFAGRPCVFAFHTAYRIHSYQILARRGVGLSNDR